MDTLHLGPVYQVNVTPPRRYIVIKKGCIVLSRISEAYSAYELVNTGMGFDNQSYAGWGWNV